LALAHDLGHPPFGHEGETALTKLHKFDHNLHTLKLVTKLEEPYPYYEGLNLTKATLEGLLKHNYPEINDLKIEGMEVDSTSPPTIEAFSAAIADDIAYNCHDLDDGIRGNFFSIEEVAEAIPLVGDILRDIKSQYPNCKPKRLLISTLIGTLIKDLITNLKRQIDTATRLEFLKNLKGKNSHMEAFSPSVREQMTIMREFLNHNLYKNLVLKELGACGGEIIQDLFTHYSQEKAAEEACDYVAGMTDRFAIDKHKKYFESKEHLRKPLTTKL